MTLLSKLEKLYDDNPRQYNSKVSEELFELGQAFHHYLDGKVSREELLKEVADVQFQLKKIRALVVGFSEEGYIRSFKDLEEMNEKILEGLTLYER